MFETIPGGTAYPAVRSALREDLATQSDEAIAGLLGQLFPESEPEDIEGFFDDVGKAFSTVAKVAAPVVSSALPGVISGAMGGAALGPIGIIGGALAGGLGSALSHQGGGGASPPARPTGGGGAGQLLGALARPEIAQGLLSMVLGGAGRSSVPIGGSPVPLGAIANLLSVLTNRASEDLGETAFAGEGGAWLEAVGDPGSAEARADALLGLLGAANAADAVDVAQQRWSSGPSSWELSDDDYDLIELARLGGAR